MPRIWRVARIVATALMAGYAVVLLMDNSFMGDRPPLGDFGSFYASGLAAMAGQNPYAVYELTMNNAVNLNPPASLLVFGPMTAIDPYRLRGLWFLATLAAIAVSVALLQIRTPGPPYRMAWVVASTPFWDTISLGQIYGFLSVPTVAAWLWLERWPLLSGVLIGIVVAIKPNFVVWAALLALIGQRRAALVAVVVAIGLNCLALVVFGPQVLGQWLAAIRNEAPNGSAANAALSGLLVRMGLSGLAPVIDALGLVALGWLVWRRQPAIQRVSSVALIGCLVFAPLAWVGYGLFLLPLFFEAPWTWLMLAAAVLLLIPRLLAQEWGSQSTLLLLTVGSAFAWAFLLVLSQQVRTMGVARRAKLLMHPRGTPAPS